MLQSRTRLAPHAQDCKTRTLTKQLQHRLRLNWSHRRLPVTCAADSGPHHSDQQEHQESIREAVARPCASTAAAVLCIAACLDGEAALPVKVACTAAVAAAAAAEQALLRAHAIAGYAAEKLANDPQQPKAPDGKATNIFKGVTKAFKIMELKDGVFNTEVFTEALRAAPVLLQPPVLPAMVTAGVATALLAAVLPSADLPPLSMLALAVYALSAAHEALDLSSSLADTASELSHQRVQASVDRCMYDTTISGIRAGRIKAIEALQQQLTAEESRAAQQLQAAEQQAAQQLQEVQQQAARQLQEVQQSAEEQLTAARAAAQQEVATALQQAEQAMAADKQKLAHEQAEIAQQQKEMKQLLRKAESEAGLAEELQQKLTSQGSRIQSLQQTIQGQQRQLKQLTKLEAKVEAAKEQLAAGQAQKEAMTAQLLLLQHQAAQAQEQLAVAQAANLQNAQQATAATTGSSLSSSSSSSKGSSGGSGGYGSAVGLTQQQAGDAHAAGGGTARAASPPRVVAFVGGRSLKESDRKMIPGDNIEIRHFGGTKDVGVGDVKRLEAAIKAGKIDEVYLQIRWNAHSTTHSVTRWCKDRGIPCHVLSSGSTARRKAEVGASSSDDEGSLRS